MPGKDAAYQIHESNSRIPYNKAAHKKDNDAHYKTQYWTPARSLYRTPAHSGKHSSASHAKKRVNIPKAVVSGAVGTAVELAVDVILTAACPACLVAVGMVSAAAGYAASLLVVHQRPTVEGMLAAAATGAVGGLIGHLALNALRRVAAGVLMKLSVKARGGAAAVRTGQAGEAAVRAKYDIGKRERYTIDNRDRISDGSTDEVISEVKNVARLSYTQQIKEIETRAANTGRSIDLYVRGGDNPTKLSAPLLEAIAKNDRFNLKEIP